MNPVAVLKRYFNNVQRSRQMLEEIREGVANLTDVTNRHLVKLAEIIEADAQRKMRTESSAEMINFADMTNRRSGQLMEKTEAAHHDARRANGGLR